MGSWCVWEGDTPFHTLPRLVASLPRWSSLTSGRHIFCEHVFSYECLDRQCSNKFTKSTQTAHFESSKSKNSLVWEGGYPLRHNPPARSLRSPLREDAYLVIVYFPINFGIDNIPRNSSKICTRSLTLIPSKCKNSAICVGGGYPLPRLVGKPPRRSSST